MEPSEGGCLVQADAVVGCFALLEGCYLLLVTKKRLHGSVCGACVGHPAECMRSSPTSPSWRPPSRAGAKGLT